ncbi:RecQ family ATP-dependent DNA helicase [bacterium SCSIO 12741]|nr:RecQ family ATP-dependent DNA helicase [bacterium SCSIO 12741]
MATTKHTEILKKYWGYDAFRPLQQDIIESVLVGTDTLALLPTGGGKSICFQVPALMSEGLCLVISPLIALMKDQVQNLQEKGIKAQALTSGMSRREIDVALDNCIYGSIKFLYVSPERLRSELFRSRVQQMNLSLIAVDEAHCISQWGYDFRPDYLEIAQLREWAPGVRMIALTATATPEVVVDIQEKLQFAKPCVFQKSFERSNLVYLVYREPDKFGKLRRLIDKVGGSGIVYVRNRRRTMDLARQLKQLGYSAEAYHAGMGITERDARQHSWIKGETQIIVATNAFGMGIDKPDVRWVVHLDLPESPEAYFQEAGRAGRDGKKSWAVLLFDEGDIEKLRENWLTSFPEKPFIKRVYTGLGNYLQLAIGSGEGRIFPFDLIDFSNRYRFNPTETFHALKLLEREGYIHLSDAVYQPSKIQVLLSKSELYNLEVSQPARSQILLTLLRSYSGMFDHPTPVREKLLAQRLNITTGELRKKLQHLHRQRVIDYQPSSETPRITFLKERLQDENVFLSKINYEDRKKTGGQKMEAMLEYVRSEQCTSQILLQYFGEDDAPECGQCNRCQQRQSNHTSYSREELMQLIMQKLEIGPVALSDLIKDFSLIEENQLIETVQWLHGDGRLEIGPGNRLKRLY